MKQKQTRKKRRVSPAIAEYMGLEQLRKITELEAALDNITCDKVDRPTPLTDAASYDTGLRLIAGEMGEDLVVTVEFARKLECENANLREALERLMENKK
ncbi:MAG: hypothetical protein DDT19_02458 [Syntrophomonadaceae bacterium]|nr:hypothetical protein [Bacillota bacterium]